MHRIAVLALATALCLLAWDANADLLEASRTGDLTAVKAALEKGAALETKTSYGQTPLYLAAMSGHEPVVRFLLEKGAQTDVMDTFYKMSVLGFALQRKHFAVAKLLIPKMQASADAKLAQVAASGNAELIQTVLESGKPSQPALDRAYEMALDRKQAGVGEALKKAGAREPAPPVTVDSKVLESYVGSYKADQFPAEIKVFVRDGKLFLQATGQPEILPKSVSPTRFAFSPAQLEIEFDTPDGFTLRQAGGAMKFKKVAVK